MKILLKILILVVFISNFSIFTLKISYAEDSTTLFVKAILNNDIKEVDTLLKQNPDLLNWESARDGNMPLSLATSVKMANLLIKYGADVNKTNSAKETALHKQRLYSYPEVMQFLISQGANVNAKDICLRTPLHMAITCPDEKLGLEIVKLLISGKANVNAKDQNGETPLKYAKRQSKYEIVKFLYECGAK